MKLRVFKDGIYQPHDGRAPIQEAQDTHLIIVIRRFLYQTTVAITAANTVVNSVIKSPPYCAMLVCFRARFNSTFTSYDCIV